MAGDIWLVQEVHCHIYKWHGPTSEVEHNEHDKKYFSLLQLTGVGCAAYSITHTSNGNGIHGICNNNAPPVCIWPDFD